MRLATRGAPLLGTERPDRRFMGEKEDARCLICTRPLVDYEHGRCCPARPSHYVFVRVPRVSRIEEHARRLAARDEPPLPMKIPALADYTFKQ
jgi:hypothetical protein